MNAQEMYRKMLAKQSQSSDAPPFKVSAPALSIPDDTTLVVFGGALLPSPRAAVCSVTAIPSPACEPRSAQ